MYLGGLSKPFFMKRFQAVLPRFDTLGTHLPPLLPVSLLRVLTVQFPQSQMQMCNSWCKGASTDPLKGISVVD